MCVSVCECVCVCVVVFALCRRVVVVSITRVVASCMLIFRTYFAQCVICHCAWQCVFVCVCVCFV